MTKSIPESESYSSTLDLRPRSTAAKKALLANLLTEKARRQTAADLARFAREAWEVLEPETPLAWNWHLDLLCEQLAQVRAGSIRRLIVNVPPQSMKSRLVTVFFPCWVWGTTPTSRFMAASYAASLSTKHSLERRKLLSSEWFQRTFPRSVSFAADQNQKAFFQNEAGGEMHATSCGGAATGVGVHFLICDDLQNPQQAESDAERTTANEFFDGTLRTRLSDPANGAIIVVMQRLHQLDLTGHLQAKEPGAWKVMSLPMEADEDERHVFPVSGRSVERKQGELLWPDRFPRVVVESLRTGLGSMRYAGQYQQRPVALEGNLIKRADVRFFGGIDPRTGEADEPLPEAFELKLISVDCSFKALTTSDYVAIAVIAVQNRRRFVLEVVNAHLGLTGTEAEIRRLHAAHANVAAVLIEDAANGSAVIERLKQNLPGVIAISPQGGKLSRLMSCTPEFEAHDWYVARNAAWSDALLDQLCAFPSTPHDDMVDAISQAATWLRSRPLPGYFEPGIVETRDDLWERATAGDVLTEDEFDRL